MEEDRLNSTSIGDTTGESSSTLERAAKTTFYSWKYRHYFTVVEEGEKNIRVHCTLCVGHKTLSSANNTTLNLRKHLSTVHKTAKLVAKEVQQELTTKTTDGATLRPRKRQSTLPLSSDSSSSIVPPAKL